MDNFKIIGFSKNPSWGASPPPALPSLRSFRHLPIMPSQAQKALYAEATQRHTASRIEKGASAQSLLPILDLVINLRLF